MEMLDVPPLNEGKIGNGFSVILDIKPLYSTFSKNVEHNPLNVEPSHHGEKSNVGHCGPEKWERFAV
jgi:hypothetical protein